MREFYFEGIKFPTVQHAFQAQKLSKDKRKAASLLPLQEVIKEGRKAPLDVTKWDNNKKTLMRNLIYAQAKQNGHMHKALIKLRNYDIVVDDLSDNYWPITHLPYSKKSGTSFKRRRAMRRSRFITIGKTRT